jgi:hypothetical protein
MYSNIYKIIFSLIAAYCVVCCGASNPAVHKELKQVISLEREKQKLEKDYLYLLGHLEKYPSQRELRLKQAELKKRLKELSAEIKSSRSQLELSIREWEERVVGGRIEKRMIDDAVREKSPRRRYRR